MSQKPDKHLAFISASAIGFYGDRGDEQLDESAAAGTGFLANVTRRWEELARAAEPFARVVILRLGIVLAANGGALAKLLLPFRLGVGGPMGTGRQWMSWIDREDVLRMIEWSIDHDSARGIYNVTAPNPATNRDFAHALGRALHRPSIMPTPAFALRLALGSEMADEMLLGGQRVHGRSTEARPLCKMTLMPEQGTVKWYNDAKGYGFIVREHGADVFVHHASIIAEGFRTLSEGDRVSFEVVEGPKGLQAKNVVKIS